MTIILLPNFRPPLEIALGDFLLQALHPRHYQRDFEALTSIKNTHRGIIDPANFWPEEVRTLEDNLRDLTKDFGEFEDGIAYRYSILSPDEASYDGCLYIRPTNNPERYDACIEFWFKSSKRELEATFLPVVKTWLLGVWGFKSLAFPGREIPWDSYHNHS